MGLALEALHVHSPVRTPSSRDASRGPRQTAGNSTFPALCCTRLPLFLSCPSPPVIEVSPQKSRCCWRELSPSSCNLYSQAVSHSPLSLSISSVRQVLTVLMKTQSQGGRGTDSSSSSSLPPGWSLFCSSGVLGSPSVWLTSTSSLCPACPPWISISSFASPTPAPVKSLRVGSAHQRLWAQSPLQDPVYFLQHRKSASWSGVKDEL